MKTLLITVCLLASIACAFADHITYTYDDAHRLTKIDYGNGVTVNYAYDKSGNLLNRSVTVANPSAADAGARKDSRQAALRSNDTGAQRKSGRPDR